MRGIHVAAAFDQLFEVDDGLFPGFGLQADQGQGEAQVVVVGERRDPDTVALRRRLASYYLPFSVRVNVVPGAHQRALGGLLPFISSMRMVDGKATAYVCSNFACQEPVTDPEALDEQLTALRSITG